MAGVRHADGRRRDLVARVRARPLRSWTPWAIAIAAAGVSAVWTSLHPEGLRSLRHRIADLAPWAAAMGAVTAMWLLGLALLALGAGVGALRALGPNPATWSATVRSRGPELLGDAVGGGAFWLGWVLAWAGTTAQGVVSLGGILLVLPMSTWSLAVLPTLSICSSVAWRLPVHRQLVRLRRDVRRVGDEPAGAQPDRSAA